MTESSTRSPTDANFFASDASRSLSAAVSAVSSLKSWPKREGSDGDAEWMRLVIASCARSSDSLAGGGAAHAVASAAM